ncbi:MAG TPA: GLUG motif-containing protein [Rhizomicrobium sp.]|nr:GLUG motif-containing protein [Rhizomicrobium sp.]
MDLGTLKSSASLLAIAAFFAGTGMSAAQAGTLPGHGHFVAGHGSIARSGQVLTIDQNSRTGIVDWKTFSVGKHNVVDFNNANGATLNRITGGNISRIAGQLHGAGSVYLINNQGVAILPTGRVVTQGSFAASGRNADGGSFGVHKRLLFTGGANGNVINRGVITSGASVTLYGGVTRAGAIAARNSVETSGEQVRMAGASVSAKSWLIDPKNLQVTASSAKAIDASLNTGTNVTLETTKTSASGPGTVSGGPGDITIAAPVAWKSTAILTLAAYRNVNIDANVAARGAGRLLITDNDAGGSGGDLLFGANASITFDNLTSVLKINGKPYTLENSIASLASATAAKPNGRYALTKNINFGSHVYTSSPLSPNDASAFTGTFEGLGHTVSNLTIIDTADFVAGLFGEVGTGATLRDIGLTNANVTALHEDVHGGTLVGQADAGTLITGAHASGTVACGQLDQCGGLAGVAQNIANSYANVAVSGSQHSGDMGGLVGYAKGSISNSYAAGNVTVSGSSASGGLAGYVTGSISNSYATGNVVSGDLSEVGGLVGTATGNIAKSYATGNVHGGFEAYLGGLVGWAQGITISGSHATGNISGATATAEEDSYAGGLVGQQMGGITQTSYATGAVSMESADVNSTNYAGGLVGYLTGNGRISQSRASGATSAGTNSDIGGLFGFADSGTSVKNSHATGNVVSGGGLGNNSSSVGGLGGFNEGTVSLSYATGDVLDGNSSAVDFDAVGGLIGYESGGAIGQSFATGNVAVTDHGRIGGLLGWIASGSVANTYATGNVSCGGSDQCFVGGLEGYDFGSLTDSYATGHLAGPSSSNIGGVTGTAGGGASSNNYWNTTTTGVLGGTGSGGALSAVGYTTAQFKQKTLAALGFSSSIWAKNTSTNGDLPYLKNNAPP